MTIDSTPSATSNQALQLQNLDRPSASLMSGDKLVALLGSKEAKTDNFETTSVYNPFSAASRQLQGKSALPAQDAASHAEAQPKKENPCQKLGHTLSHAFHTVSAAAHKVENTASRALHTVTHAVSSAWHTATHAVSQVWHKATHAVSSAWKGVSHDVSGVWHDATHDATKLVHGAKKDLSTVVGAAKSDVSSLGSSAKKDVSKLANGAVSNPADGAQDDGGDLG